MCDDLLDELEDVVGVFVEAAELVHDVCVDHEVALVVSSEGSRVVDFGVEDLPDERNGREGNTGAFKVSVTGAKGEMIEMPFQDGGSLQCVWEVLDET